MDDDTKAGVTLFNVGTLCAHVPGGQDSVDSRAIPCQDPISGRRLLIQAVPAGYSLHYQEVDVVTLVEVTRKMN